MPGTPPTSSTFPSSITCTIVPPSSSALPPSNILILLHSIGDTQANFANLARNLNLPETTAISLAGPKPLPFDLPGYQWGEDVVFQGANLVLDAKFEEAGYKTVDTVVEKLLETGWKPREILFFGWGQGAICVFDYLLRQGVDSNGMRREFGGVVAIGGVVGEEVKTVVPPGTSGSSSSGSGSDDKRSKTPVLVCGGRNGLVTKRAEERLASLFGDLKVVRWEKEGDGMMNDAKEAGPVMQFFARRLLRRRGVPEEFTELPA